MKPLTISNFTCISEHVGYKNQPKIQNPRHERGTFSELTWNDLCAEIVDTEVFTLLDKLIFVDVKKSFNSSTFKIDSG